VKHYFETINQSLRRNQCDVAVSTQRSDVPKKPHDEVPDGSYHESGDHTRRHAILQEVDVRQVQLADFVFLRRSAKS
jgi:hypothetical protein